MHPLERVRAVRAMAVAAGLDPIGREVFTAIALYMDANGGAFPSQATIARDADVSERTVRDRVKRIEALGLFRRQRTQARGGTVYRFACPAVPRAAGLPESAGVTPAESAAGLPAEAPTMPVDRPAPSAAALPSATPAVVAPRPAGEPAESPPDRHIPLPPKSRTEEQNTHARDRQTGTVPPPKRVSVPQTARTLRGPAAPSLRAVRAPAQLCFEDLAATLPEALRATVMRGREFARPGPTRVCAPPDYVAGAQGTG